MKFIFLKNGHVGNDSQSNHSIQQTNRIDMQSFVAYLGPNKILSFSNFWIFIVYLYSNERNNIFEANNTKLMLSMIQCYWVLYLTYNTNYYSTLVILYNAIRITFRYQYN